MAAQLIFNPKHENFQRCVDEIKRTFNRICNASMKEHHNKTRIRELTAHGYKIAQELPQKR